MADSKITELTELTTPAAVDVLPIVDDPSGSPITKKVSITSLMDVFTNDSIYRQAIINGNFDVWQRGTTSTNPASISFLADRWKTYFAVDGGTDPANIVHSRQSLLAGIVPGSFYHYRIAPDGAGSGYGANSAHLLINPIEHGVRYLCGAGRKVTVSFYARASVASKKIGLYLNTAYGSGGSPSAQEAIVGDKFTLTSTWTKFTHTFTTNTLDSKTFGTANDDNLQVIFAFQWGTGTFATNVNSAGIAETLGGSGWIDITQVQLCAGDIALPFMPKSFGQELRDCQRYFQYFSSADDIYATFASGFCSSTTSAVVMRPLFQKMRIDPTLAFSTVNTDFIIYDGGASTATTNVQDDRSTSDTIKLVLTAASGLTDGSGCTLISNNKTTAYIAVSAEL